PPSYGAGPSPPAPPGAGRPPGRARAPGSQDEVTGQPTGLKSRCWSATARTVQIAPSSLTSS
ncbi:MAG: hypothetical protein JWP95_1935, partial [Actinotalea sp.]|nr:hypothetical protein [Actinotalea sp.]